MSGFDPGDGWRRLAKGERDQDEMIVYYGDEGSTSWVRVPAVPPLPTEPYTVIRVTWAKGARKSAQDVLVMELGGWCDLEGTIYDRGTTAASITSFEVLAEPRAVTAKAVLDRVREYFGMADDGGLRDIDREFGAES